MIRPTDKQLSYLSYLGVHPLELNTIRTREEASAYIDRILREKKEDEEYYSFSQKKKPKPLPPPNINPDNDIEEWWNDIQVYNEKD